MYYGNDIHRSATSGGIAAATPGLIDGKPRSQRTSPHLMERGARAIDFQVEATKPQPEYCKCSKKGNSSGVPTHSDVRDAMEATAFYRFLDNYSDNHIHISLPNIMRYGGGLE